MIENRKSFRLPFRTKIVFGNPERVSTGNAVNISAGGVFVMTIEPFPRETRCQCIFQLSPDEEPICVRAVVKRVVASSPNPEETPGMGLTFLNDETDIGDRIQHFMDENRKNFEMAATILMSGEPDISSLEPLLGKMHLPPFSDLSELRFYLERILRSIELVEQNS